MPKEKESAGSSIPLVYYMDAASMITTTPEESALQQKRGIDPDTLRQIEDYNAIRLAK